VLRKTPKQTWNHLLKHVRVNEMSVIENEDRVASRLIRTPEAGQGDGDGRRQAPGVVIAHLGPEPRKGA
jgi:hypothetical protein